MGMLKKITPFEAKDLIISWIALAIAFTVGAMGLINLFATGFKGFSITNLILYFVLSLVVVGLSFILHELAHKFTAIKYGFWSEFRKNNSMLVISVALAAILGVVFAAPGATLINTGGREITKKQNGVISVMGPLVNLGLFIVFTIVLVIGLLLGGYNYGPLTVPSFLVVLGEFGCLVNGALIFFNMLPVGPLDGRKVLRWNPVIFAIMMIIGAGLVVLGYYYNIAGLSMADIALKAMAAMGIPL